MTFEFVRREGEEISLEDAIVQAVGAASTCWENMSGTGVFQDDRAREIANVLMADILRRVKTINDKHEAEVSKWKTRLVEETARLRGIIEKDSSRWLNVLREYWPEEAKAWQANYKSERADLPHIVSDNIQKLRDQTSQPSVDLAALLTSLQAVVIIDTTTNKIRIETKERFDGQRS